MAEIDIAAPAAQSASLPRITDALSRIITGLAILVLWEAIVRMFAPPFVAKPTSVLLAIPRVIIDPAFLQAAGITLVAVGWGLLISIVVGTLIGLLIGRSPLADQVLRQYINFFNAMPMVVVLPLVSLWFGYTDGARLATIVFAAIFSIILNTADGARAVPREHLEVANSFRSRKLRTISKSFCRRPPRTSLQGCDSRQVARSSVRWWRSFFSRLAGLATTSCTIRAPSITTRPSSECCCSQHSGSALSSW
jgi:ABC-type anion transport system duplicated permease subunit